MYAWGSTVHGELGLGGIEEEHVFIPKRLEWRQSQSVIDCACGGSHTLLLTCDGKVYSCGNNDHGQLGHGQARKRPQLVEGLNANHITHVACGKNHSLALNQWGQLFAWGSDDCGQLGLDLSENKQQAVPKILKALTTHHIVQIASGENHCMALTNSGDLFSWGANTYGQLGIGTVTPLEKIPAIISSLAGIPIAYIACGGDHSFAVSKSGAVFGWGRNLQGQLGLSDTTSRSYPCQLRTLRNMRIKYIACGLNFSTFLTNEGGVLTCGAGMFGQLGHGSTSDESLPKQVVELMGSTVTQIICGRQHTLVLAPSNSKVYGFGLGGAGQLGSKNPVNSSTPQLVIGPWMSMSKLSMFLSSDEKENVIVKKIFAGGDHCFAAVVSGAEVVPYDCRVYSSSTQIQYLDMSHIDKCLEVESDDNVDLEIVSYIECVFKSLACFNASFLLLNDGHYSCSSKHHGIDVDALTCVFDKIAKLEKDSLKNLIWTCITEELLGKLTVSPPDVEVLRVYLTLPVYHEFCNPKNHRLLHKPFVDSILNLKVQANRVLRSWYTLMSNEYFEKLIINFKNVAVYILQGQSIPENQTASYDSSLSSMLEMLKFLNNLNHSSTGLKVPYDVFHMPELNEILDVRYDYLSWLVDLTNKFYLCNYPFIFDAEAKIVLLQTDQMIQMQNAVNTAMQQTVLSLINPMNAEVQVLQFLFLNVSRENIVADSIRELSSVTSSDLKKPLKVKFIGEEAEDGGGVRKEFFMLLVKEIFDPKYGMFKEYEETRAMWFSEDSYEEDMMYFLVGLICGLVIYNYTIINIPFPLALYKKLLGEPVQLSDLLDLSPSMTSSMQSLLEYSGSDFQQVFDLNFEITRDVYGEIRHINLKLDGDQIPVTQENKKEYVDLYIDYIFNESVKKQFDAFSRGFMKVCGGRVLQLFHSHELKAVMVGNENYDWHALEEAAEYKGDYRSSDQTIRWFWEVIHELPLCDKKKFLLFLTGSDRIPIQGMKAIKLIIQPTNDEKFLPVAHTCFNLLDLPRYQTKERLKYKLLQAIQQNVGFSLV